MLMIDSDELPVVAWEGLDRFGGWRDLPAAGGAPAAFRVEYTGTRWQLVTPEGHTAFSLGVNHLSPGPVLASLGETAFQERYGDEAAFYPAAVRQIQGWGFTALGHVRQPWTGCGMLPYLWQLSTAPSARGGPSLAPVQRPARNQIAFPDVFSTDWAALVDRVVVAAAATVASDPFFLGYCFTDVPEWSIEYARRTIGRCWGDALAALPAHAAGKQAYVALMRRHYRNDIDWFNAVYRTSLSGFDALLRETPPPPLPYWNPDEARRRADDEAWRRVIAEQYYATICNVVRRHDPHHLLLGDRFDANLPVADDVLRIAAMHVDVICLEYYQFDDLDLHLRRIESMYAATGKPLLLCDGCYAVASPDMPNVIGPRCATQQERGEALASYLVAVAELAGVIGWHWCGYADHSITLEPPPRGQHSGLCDPTGRPHAEVVGRVPAALEAIHRRWRAESDHERRATA